MMLSEVRYEQAAVATLKKIDKFEAKIITNWIEKHLIDCEKPKIHGKGLISDKSGFWRYRIGDYRLIADVSEKTVTILRLEIGHGKNVNK